MPSVSTLSTFVVVVAAFAAVPGPSNLYVVAQGLRMGRRSALAAAVGCACGAATYVAATTVGLAALLASSATALSVLHYVGGAYLVFLGVRAWRSRELPARENTGMTATDARPARTLARGFLVELSNPKVALFFLAFFPQFVHRSAGSVTEQLLILGVLFCVIGLLSDSTYALVFGTLRQRIAARRRLLAQSTRASSVLYLGLGAWSIWSGADTRAR